MNAKLIEDIAAAILYEGYLLYPYRASAVKNRQRFNFGVLYPRAYAEQSGSEAWSMQTECLLRADSNSTPRICVRFLHLATGGAREREIALPAMRLSELESRTLRHSALIPPFPEEHPLEAAVELTAQRLRDGLYKLRVGIFNAVEFARSTREEALAQALVSAHTILSIDHGEFISLIDPPDDLKARAEECKNVGTWPVLAGEEGARDAMLSSSIILYDHPKIAPESAGALFDGTEIDEILTLRIMTLTEAEKLAMAQSEERTREILERTESMPPEQFMKMHGALRALP